MLQLSTAEANTRVQDQLEMKQTRKHRCFQIYVCRLNFLLGDALQQVALYANERIIVKGKIVHACKCHIIKVTCSAGRFPHAPEITGAR